MKICIKCNKPEPEVIFTTGKNRCKNCIKLYRQEYHIKNKDKIKAQQKTYYKKNKKNVLRYQKEYYYSVNGKINSMYNTSKRRAKKKNMPFDLTKEWIIQQLETQNHLCALTQLPFLFEETENQLNPYAPSLDRIDPNKGYTQDNVRIVCSIINLSLNEFGEETFKKICESYLSNLSDRA